MTPLWTSIAGRHINELSFSSFLPTTVAYTPFDTAERCEAALIEARSHWNTVDHESKCVNLDLQAKIQKAKDDLWRVEHENK